MQKNGFKIIYILLLLVVLTYFTKGYAQAIYEYVVSATVPPHYNVKARGDNLYIQTNMKVYINSKSMQF